MAPGVVAVKKSATTDRSRQHLDNFSEPMDSSRLSGCLSIDRDFDSHRA
jgi:hypothetical protein